jgi:hypothetical protein
MTPLGKSIFVYVNFDNVYEGFEDVYVNVYAGVYVGLGRKKVIFTPLPSF